MTIDNAPLPIIKPLDPLNPSLEEAAAIFAGLVADFAANEKQYLAPNYQEAEVRKDFIDKFLIALGWDVNHDVQKNPLQQEVKVERNVQMATAQKRADYSFALAPHFDTPVLYVEAKKPSGDIATADNYFQTIRYAYQKSHPIGVLTDFEQLHLIDCRYKPNVETALARNIKKYHYSDFLKPERFAEIYFLLARPAVMKGSISAYAEKLPKPKGRPGQTSFLPSAHKPVDEALLEELDDYRKSLARELKNRNRELGAAELTELTQRILDRLVFIRFLEDKLIEPDHLIASFGDTTTSSAWRDFIAASRRLDKTYNGVVFKHHPRLDAAASDPAALAIDDKPFADLLNAFDHTRSPYLFNEIPIHILGSIYERFLGNVITTTAKRADLEPKPEVRKAGGVYYTPQYIVEYIVANTVGKLIDGTTPDAISKLRFADIACGSGSFLLGVYDCLLKYHRAWYNKNPGKAPKGAVIKKTGTDGVPAYYLSLEEKSRILTNNVYGVDIDPQAVEVAQLSLYLKLLEDETTATARQFTMDFKRPLLPSLGNNIKCGNSLIGSDYYHDEQLDMLDPDVVRKVNVFDWQKEFQNITAAGGFDAIVGNPPYVRMEEFKPVKDYLRRKYLAHQERADLYAYFVERAINLIAPSGLIGLIVSNKFVRAKYGIPLRQFLGQHASIRSITDFAGADVFKGATVRTFVLIASRRHKDALAAIYSPVPSPEQIVSFERRELTVEAYAIKASFSLDPSAFVEPDWRLGRRDLSRVLDTMKKQGHPLHEIVGSRALFGLKTGCNEAFVVNSTRAHEMCEEDPATRNVLQRVLFGKDIRRYKTEYAGRHVLYLHPDKQVNEYSAVLTHLKPFRRQLEQRAGSQAWYELQQPAVALLPYRKKPKIVYPIIANECRFTLETDGYLVNDKAFIIPTDSKAILAVLNSRLSFFYFSSVCAALEGKADRYLEFRSQYVDAFPIPPAVHEPRFAKRLEVLVTSILSLHRQFPAAKTDHARTLFERQIASTDAQIDALVYELYGLTKEEITLVEAATAVF